MSSSKSLTQQKNSSKINFVEDEEEEVVVKPKKMITRSSESKTPLSKGHKKILLEYADLITKIEILNYQIKTLKDKMKVARIALDEI